ncbi:MAG: DUF559 domain-containing protein [Bacteroidota bacterium]
MIPASSSNNYHYNPKLKQKAQILRASMTKAEASLWKYVLRAKLLGGYSFKRQRPVLEYIADFFCEDLMLIIEIDGSSHDIPEVFENDLIRAEVLQKAGFTILRFSNEEVLNDIEIIKRKLINWIEDQ